jgi:hypothetical protein
MVGRDDPRVFTKSGIRDFLEGFSPAGRLNDAGYSEGDIFPIAGVSTQKERATATTSTTYTSETSLHDSIQRWDRIGPTDNIYVALSLRFNAGAGETPSGRIYNNTDNEEIISTTGDAGTITDVFTDWQDYKPPTNTSPVQLFYEHKTDTGTNSITTAIPTLWYGVQL